MEEVVDIGEYEHPKSSISPVMIEKDLVFGNSLGNFSLACLYSHSCSGPSCSVWNFRWGFRNGLGAIMLLICSELI